MMSESTEAVTNTGDVEKLPGHVDVKLNGDSDQTLKVTSNENDTEKDKLAPISSTDSEPTPTATDAEPVSNITESKLASDSAPAPAKAGEATVNTDSSLKDDANSVTEAKESEAEAVNISQNSTKTESPVSEKSDPSEVKSSESPSLEKSECKDDYSKSPSKVESPATKKAESPAEEKKTPSPSRKRKLSPEKADEESEDDSEDEKVGTLEADPVIEDGVKRVRKKTERLSDVIGKDRVQKEDDKNKIPEGSGVPLGDIEFISHAMKTSRPDELKLLHSVAFGRVAKQGRVRVNLRKFKGFEYAVDSPECQKKVKRYISDRKTKTADLKKTLKILGLELGGSKDELVERLFDFLACPKDLGMAPASAKKGKRAAKKTPSKKGKKASGSKGKKSKKAGSSDEDEDEDEEEEMEVEETPKKPAKRGRSSKGSAKSTPKKKTPAKRKSKKESEDEQEISDIDSNDSDDKEPEAKKAKKMPTDEELKQTILGLLENVDLEKVTMKNVLQQIYEKYDGLDLTHKKEYLKSVVKDILSN